MPFDRFCTCGSLVIECLKFVELVESQKSSISIFAGLKGLNKIQKNKKNSKPPKLVRQSLSKQFRQKPNILFVFSLKIERVKGI